MTTEAADAPRDLLGFDPFDPLFHADPYPQYELLRDHGPVYRTRGGLWVAPSHAACSIVLRDPRFGHGSGEPEPSSLWDDEPSGQPSFLLLDPPDHTRLRRLVSKAFTSRLVERLRPRVTAVVDELLDAALAADTLDVISDVAYPLPVTLISELLGVPPEDHERFEGWSAALARSLDPAFLLPPWERDRAATASAEFRAYFAELADRRRVEPADDLLSALVAVEEQGDVLTREELLSTCVLLLVAGHETTVNLIGNGTLALLRNPDQWAHLSRHPDEAPAAVEELLRYDPPVQLTARVALDDAEITVPDGAGVDHVVTVEKGEQILLLIGAANRDPAVFPDPGRLDLTREAGRQLAFGLGIHFCLGAPLARLEGQVALASLARRAPGLRLADDELVYKDNLVLRGLTALAARP